MINFLSEITEKSMGTYLDKRKWMKRYYVDYFPLKSTSFLTYEVLVGLMGVSAADLVSYNSSAPEKTRRVLDRLSGSLPACRVKRTMDENAINQYIIAKNTIKNDADMVALLNMVFGDIDFVVESVQQRCEWIALTALSQTKISLNQTNSAGVITEEAIDFGLPAANKEFVGGAAANRTWLATNFASCLPITDITTIVLEALKAGVVIKHILMNPTKFLDFRASNEVKDFVYGIMVSESGLTPGVAPTLKTINRVLTESGLPDIRIINTFIDLETRDHNITATDPWLNSAGHDKYVTFIPDGPLGSMLHGPIAAESVKDPGIVQKKVGHVLVQSVCQQDPIMVSTIGLSNVFVCFDKINMVWSLNSESHTAWL
ncbi:hypothetical protein ES703_105416 [subsurface metagenome]